MGRTWMLALCALFAAGVGPAPEIPGEPPLAPGAEAPISPPQTPHPECVAQALQTLAITRGRLVRALVTRSRRWGDVWRADFETADVEPPLVNRIVCWQGEAMQIAVGQNLAPLPVSPPSSTKASGVQCVYTPFENPCRGDPVQVVSLCVRPGVYIYPGGRSETVQSSDSFEVAFINHGRGETDAQWSARCAARGGVQPDDDD